VVAVTPPVVMDWSVVEPLSETVSKVSASVPVIVITSVAVVPTIPTIPAPVRVKESVVVSAITSLVIPVIVLNEYSLASPAPPAVNSAASTF